MSGNTRDLRARGRPWPLSPRTAVVVLATVGLALLAAACGASPAANGTGSPTDASGSATSQLLAFSHCMRSHGVPRYPDPQPSSKNAKVPTARQLGVSNSQLQAAEHDCQNLLPPGSDDRFPPSELPVVLQGMRRFSECMRSHGVPDWPDPSTNSQGQPYFPVSSAGISRGELGSRRITTSMNECQHLLPRALGGEPVG